MYWPTHRPQLTGIATQGVDCGPRATQMALDWLSKGKVVPGVKRIRQIMDDQDTTNYHQWDDVIDQLGGETLGFSGEKSNVWVRARDHMNDGGAVIWAVHYGVWRRSMPAKSGSTTFDGYHAVLTVGSRVRGDERQWRSFDSLLDGRYRGAPNGPVWVPQQKAKKAAWRVGQDEGLGRDAVFAVLLHRDPNIDPIEPGDLLPEGGITLGDLLADITEEQAATTDSASAARLGEMAEGLGTLIGVSANPEADEGTPVESGVSV